MSSACRVLAVVVSLLATAASAAPPADAPISTVAQLYRTYAWEALFDEPRSSGEDLLDQPRGVLRKYFDERLTSLLLGDRECVNRTGEICKLDFDPIWASQDPAAFELKVLPGPKPNVVRVQFKYPSNGQRQQLIYKMTKTNEGWRISDIEYERGPSLVSILSSKP